MKAVEMAPLPLASQRVVVTPSSAVTASPTQHFVRFEASPVTYTSAVPLTPAGVQMLQRNVFAFNEAEMRTYEGLIRNGFDRDQAYFMAGIERKSPTPTISWFDFYGSGCTTCCQYSTYRIGSFAFRGIPRSCSVRR